jgi:hypothetical protein
MPYSLFINIFKSGQNATIKGVKNPAVVGGMAFYIEANSRMLVLDVPRVQCYDCGCIKQIHLRFTKEHKRYTRFLNLMRWICFNA